MQNVMLIFTAHKSCVRRRLLFNWRIVALGPQKRQVVHSLVFFNAKSSHDRAVHQPIRAAQPPLIPGRRRFVMVGAPPMPRFHDDALKTNNRYTISTMQACL